MADGSIETLFRKKLAIYHRLATLVKEEKSQIVAADVAALWRMSEKKQKLANEIGEIREQILEAASGMSIDHGMTSGNFQVFRLLSLLPAEHRKRLDGFQASLSLLKNEIRSICMDNKNYVEWKLGIIEELISIMTGHDREQQGYGAKQTRTRSVAAMLFRREV